MDEKKLLELKKRATEIRITILDEGTGVITFQV